MTFELVPSWLDGTGIEGPDALTWADVRLALGGRTLEAVDLRTRSIRPSFVTSLLPLAEWLVEAWPRLTEERARPHSSAARHWLAAHTLRAGRGGGPMPDVRLRRLSDESFEVDAREDETRPPGISLSFIYNVKTTAPAHAVVEVLARVIDAVRDRLRDRDAWAYDDLTRRWQLACSVLARAAGRLGLGLDALEALSPDDRDALATFAADINLLRLGETSMSPCVRDRLEDARRVAAALPPEASQPQEGAAWTQARFAVQSAAPWVVGWSAADGLRERTNLDPLVPLGDKLQPWLEQAFAWPIQRQLTTLVELSSSSGIDSVVVHPRGRVPITVTRLMSNSALRFRLAKSLYYSLCTDDELIVDAPQLPRYSEANAFAAEFLAPRAFIEENAPPDRLWFDDDVERVAKMCEVAPRVIEHQIANRGLGQLAA